MANVFTDSGCQYVASLLSANTALTPDFIAWGSGAGVASKTDTTLFTEENETRVLTARAIPAPDTAQWQAAMVALQAKTITNAAVFSDIVGGYMLLKANFPGIILAPGAAILFTFTLRIIQAP